MNTMLKLVVSATLLLAGGSWTVPAGANEVAVTDDVSWGYPSEPDLDIFRVRCTQPANLMCVALFNGDPDGTLLATAVVASPSGLVGQAQCWTGNWYSGYTSAPFSRPLLSDRPPRPGRAYAHRIQDRL